MLRNIKNINVIIPRWRRELMYISIGNIGNRRIENNL